VVKLNIARSKVINPLFPNGQINRELWWFGDKGYRLVSPQKGLSDQEAIIWLDKEI
jgi:hypothetical protein